MKYCKILYVIFKVCEKEVRTDQESNPGIAHQSVACCRYATCPTKMQQEKTYMDNSTYVIYKDAASEVLRKK